MKYIKLPALAAILAASLITITSSAQAQNANNNNNNGGNNRGGNFRQQMTDRMKAALKVTDDEWAVLQPLIEKVQTLQRETRGGGGFGGGPGGGRRGGGNGGNGGADTAGGAAPGGAPGAGGPPGGGGLPEAQALRTALDDANSSPETIKAKLTALRDARKKATGELEAARVDLKKVLTQRQEATLVSMGILE